MSTDDALLLTTKAAAELLSLSPRTLESWRRQGRGPKHVTIGTLVRYRREELTEWINSQEERRR